MDRLDHSPVVAIDIDGTLGDYHGWFIQFAEMWVGRKLPSPHEINPGQKLNKHLKMSKSTYRQCKLAYRQGGLKRGMPVYDGARELTVAIRKTGAKVYICTTRPYLRLDNIDPDTRHWLRRNKIQFDGVIWGPNKYRDLVRYIGSDRIVALIDDLPEMLEQARCVGIGNIYMRDQPYNRHVDAFPRIDNLEDGAFLEQVLHNIKSYKEEHYK